jgi:hypothetical protein
VRTCVGFFYLFPFLPLACGRGAAKIDGLPRAFDQIQSPLFFDCFLSRFWAFLKFFGEGSKKKHLKKYRKINLTPALFGL